MKPVLVATFSNFELFLVPFCLIILRGCISFLDLANFTANLFILLFAMADEHFSNSNIGIFKR